MGYIFVIGRFRKDMNEYVERSSLRKMSEELSGEISTAKLHRMNTGKSVDLSINDVIAICNIMEKSPYDYVDKVLF